MKPIIFVFVLFALLGGCSNESEKCTPENTKNCAPGSKEKKEEGKKKLERKGDPGDLFKK
jgi:hypothetical protein